MGAGRSFKAYFDGDGHFKPKITINNVKLKDINFSDNDNDNDWEDDELELGFGA